MTPRTALPANPTTKKDPSPPWNYDLPTGAPVLPDLREHQPPCECEESKHQDANDDPGDNLRQPHRVAHLVPLRSRKPSTKFAMIRRGPRGTHPLLFSRRMFR
jgi:hypothetical protein